MIKTLILRNVKGISGRFDLSPLSIMTGANGSGKSTILESLSILTTGYTPLGKKPAAILALASDKCCEISGEDEHGNILTRRFEQRGASGSASVTLNGAALGDKAIPESFAIPCESIHPHEFMGMSGDKRASFLFSSISGLDDKIKPDQLGLRFDWFTAPIAAPVLLDTLTAKYKALKDERDRCQANLQRLMGQGDSLPAGTLQEWKERLAKIEADLEVALKEQAVNAESANIGQARMTQLQAMERNIQQGREKIRATEQDLESKRAQRKGMGDIGDFSSGAEAKAEEDVQTIGNQLIREELLLKADIKRLDDLKAGVCPTCGCKGPTLQAITDDLEFGVAGRETKIETARADMAMAKAKWARIKGDNDTRERARLLDNEISVTATALVSYRGTLAKLDGELQEFQAKAPPPPVDSSVIDAKVQGLRASKDDAKKAIESFTAAQAVRQQRVKAEETRQKLDGEMEAVTIAAKEVKALRDQILVGISETVIGPFRTAVSMAFECEAYLEILDEKNKPTVDFGLVKDRKRIGFDTLSGGERLVILVALIAAIQIAKIGRPKLVLVEMAEADSDRLQKVCQVIQRLGYEQAVLASCHHHGVLAGWQTYSMEGWRKS